MFRGHKFVTWSLTGLLIIIVGLIIFIATFDWNQLKPTINSRVSNLLERPFAIRGELGIDWHRHSSKEGWQGWVPWPHIHAEDVVLGNPDYIPEDRMASLQRIEAQLSLLELLSMRIVIPHIDVTQPNASLIRIDDGRNNWSFALGGEDDDSTQPTGSEPSWQVDIGEIVFDQGRLSYRDEPLDAEINATIDPLGQPISFAEIAEGRTETDAAKPTDYAFGWKAEGRYRGEALSGEGKLGGILALQDSERPFPLQADISSGTTHASFVGVLIDPMNRGGLDIDLKFSGESLDNLYRLTGVTLPATPAYATDGHLIAHLNRPEGATYRYENFNGRIGDSDIHGTLTYTLGEPRPRLEGELTTQQLRFRDLAPLIGADSNEQKAERGEESRQPEDKVLPVEEFNTARWQTMDADVTFSATHIEHGQTLPLDNLYTHLTLQNGELLLDPLRFEIAGGNLNTTLRLEGNSTPMPGRIDLHARGLQLKELMPNADTMRNALGEINGDASLSAIGNSVASLLGTSNGEMSMLISNGTISRNLMELAGLNVGNYLVGQLFGDEAVRINCAAANLSFDDGVVTPEVFVIDTENALVTITGSVNLSDERLDLNIEPDSKGARIFTLRSPLYLRGTFHNPSPGVETVPLLARGAAAVALGSVAAPAAALLALVSPSEGEETPCTPLLERIDTQPQ